MVYVIIALSLVWLIYLINEKRSATRNRNRLKHVIHVNGIRGKTSVTRMIAAGLSAGGYSVLCKTTGTIPSYITPDGEEHEIHRRGKANIKEQLYVMGIAAQAGADVLVVECMALDPAYQHVSQHQMLKADIGVITNVRMDHGDVFGHSLEGVAQALSSMIPKGGMLFTGERDFFPALQANAAALGSRAVMAAPEEGMDYGVEFAENGAVALAVCEHLGVDRQTALSGMAGYKKDRYTLAAYTLPGGAVVINGLSINDAQSIMNVYNMISAKGVLEGRRLTLLINNRADRPDRTAQMAGLAERLNPSAIWLAGKGNGLFIKRYKGDRGCINSFNAELPFDKLDGSDAVLAIGNIAGPGLELTERLEREGCAIVL